MPHKSTVNVNFLQAVPVLTPRHLGLLMLLMACAVLITGQLYVTIPLIADIMVRFEVVPASAVLTGSFFGMAYAAGFLLFGPLSDRFGRKRVILAGLSATALATALVGVAQSFGLLLLARAAQGIAASAFPPAALSLVAEQLPPQHRPLGVSLMSFAFLGSAPLAQFFAASLGALPTIMLTMAPLYLLGAAGLLLAIRAESTPGQKSADDQSSRLQPLLVDPMVLAAWAAASTVLFSFVAFHAGAQVLGAGSAVDLQTLRLIGLPPLLLTFVAAPLTRHHGPALTARIGLLLAVLGLLVAMSGSSLAMIAASIIVSGGVALAVPGLIATVAASATNRNRGLALAIYSFCLFLGASLAPPVAQSLAGFGPTLLWLLPAVLLGLAALGVTIATRTHPASTII
ncbi:MAG: MFS transporter [Desulfopila sp.]